MGWWWWVCSARWRRRLQLFCCRVGVEVLTPTPLTEPDLWATHPALQVGVSSAEQRKLPARDPSSQLPSAAWAAGPLTFLPLVMCNSQARSSGAPEAST